MNDKFICFGTYSPSSSIKDVAKRCLITCPMKDQCEKETMMKEAYKSFLGENENDKNKKID